MTELLEKIDSPRDLSELSTEQLEQLAEEIREFLICTVAETGGHLASNLGVVELTLALHRHLESPEDKIVWDVGHQCYTHKIVTGRREQMPSIRCYQGLSGYPKYQESEHDIINTGHSGTSISSALGLAEARDRRGGSERVYCVIGDGAITGGMAFEALNHAGDLGTSFKVILNDNEMSISRNVGALSGYLTRLRTDPGLRKISSDMAGLLNSIPGIGSGMFKTFDKAKDSLKYILVPGILFEELGFTYLGPIPGHDLTTLQEVFQQADQVEGPVLIHVNTIKGRGYHPAESCPRDYHGVGPFKIENGESEKTRNNLTYSQVFGETMVKMGRKDIRLAGITAAMPAGTGFDIFQEKFPERFYDTGIAEQHALTLAAGLARGGLRPVVALYSTFLQRGYDQVIHDICLQDVPVTIAIDRAGIVGSDGETHQGLFDLSFLRAVPNLTLMAPKDENELVQMLHTAYQLEHPVAVRYPRGEGEGVKVNWDPEPLKTGEGEILLKGREALVLAAGSRVYPAVRAAEELKKEGISVTVYNPRFIKPLPGEIIELARSHDYIITVEENVLSGGFGSAVLELFSNHRLNRPVLNLAVPDEFVPHGGQEKMRSHYGLDSRGIKTSILNFIRSGSTEEPGADG